MKKAKIILSAIVVFGLAGGVFAFKANRGLLIYTGTAANSCPNAVIGTYGTGITAYITFDPSQTTNCVLALYTLQEQ